MSKLKTETIYKRLLVVGRVVKTGKVYIVSTNL
jgi:hypothetical protein